MATDAAPPKRIEDASVRLKYFPGSGLWYAEVEGFPEVNTFHKTWGGLRFRLQRSLDDYIKLVGLVNKKAKG